MAKVKAPVGRGREAEEGVRQRAGQKRAKARKPKHAAKPPESRVALIEGQASLDLATDHLLELECECAPRLVSIGGRPPLRLRAPGFAGLAAIIVSQQVSVASANAIFGRLEARLAPLGADGIAGADDEALRSCGLSTAKINTLRALAQAAREGLDLAALAALPAAEAHARLTAVKGIGPWTADVFLLFCLGHPDAFPAGDLALQEAARMALNLKTRPDSKRLEQLAERWRPYRGVAARMLWAYYREAKKGAGMMLNEGA